MTSLPSVQYASRTDKGMRRAMNQDSLQVRIGTDPDEWSRCGYLFVVADGMGGHAVGDLASRIAVEELPHAYFKRDAATIENRLRDAILAANRAINNRGRENREFEGMGTTCSVLSLTEQGAFVGHVGDSRVYRIRNGQIQQMTEDHSLLNDYMKMKRLSEEEIRNFPHKNVIVRALGMKDTVKVDTRHEYPRSGDVVLLCSDGLSGPVSDPEILRVVTETQDLEAAAAALIAAANSNGGPDNITCVLARWS